MSFRLVLSLSHLLRHATLLAVLLIGGLSAATSAENPGQGIAVLNLEKVFEESALVAHRSNQLRALGQEVQTRMEALSEEVRNLETELQIRPATHPRHGEFREQFEVAKLRQELYRDRQRSRLQNQEMELLRQSYDDIHQLITEFGREQGFAMIMLLTEGPIEAPNVQTLRIQMGQRTVLYHNPSLDVTEAFITFANSRFRGSEGGASGEQGAP